MNDEIYAACEAKLARARQLKAEVMPHNKRVLFEAPSMVGIALVSISFNGVGDSGQIEAVDAFGLDNRSLELPRGSIAIKAVDPEAGVAVEREVSVADYLEELTQDLLGTTHCGWEDNEGAYGEFRLVAAEQSITLEYNERYIDTKLYCHEAGMAHSYYHAVSSARRFGGAAADYQALHDWLDASKMIIADFGTPLCGTTSRAASPRRRCSGTCIEDLGRIPSFADWVRNIRPDLWMGRVGTRLDASDPALSDNG